MIKTTESKLWTPGKKGAFIFARMEGLNFDQISDPDLRKLVDLPYPGRLIGHNELTPGFSTLIGRLCLDSTEPGGSGLNGGLLYCGLGAGDGGWDPVNPPAPTGSETGMVAEYFRKSWSNAYFVDPSGTPVSVATAIANNYDTVDFEVVFNIGEGTGNIMELGIWGGDATAALGSGTLCDYETLERIPKPSNAQLTFIFRWSF